MVFSASAQKDTTAHGHRYALLKDVSGPVAKIDDVASIDVVVYADTNFLGHVSKTELIDVPLIDPATAQEADQQGIMEVLMKMSVGDSAAYYFPIGPEMQFDPMLAGKQFLIYYISLRNIITMAEFDARMQARQTAMQAREAAFSKAMEELAPHADYFKARAAAVTDSVKVICNDYTAGKLKPTAGTGGMKVLILKEGTGAAVQKDQMVIANYFGSLTDGARFDDSFSRGQPFNFLVGNGQVIEGWDKGFEGLKKGTTAVLFIPSDMGYGASGAGDGIPPNAELVFYVEVLDSF
jgi:FKBP-type peptidyl-prolyl cis-trans isomerase